MSADRLILCGGLRAPTGESYDLDPIRLRLGGNDPNVTLKVQDISERLLKTLPDPLLDLLEIATYVYCADQAWKRGGDAFTGNGAKWRRKFRLHIPVRDPSRWSSDAVLPILRETLGFLSDDEYYFTFSKLENDQARERYFEFGPDAESGFIPEEVGLFSGGLDSLAGAVKEAILEKRKIALVSHRSNPKIVKRQRDLMTELSTAAKGQLFYVPVWVHKQKEMGKEYTQRTRSFLYASLAAVVARLFGLSRIRFYENGPISINLPITQHVLGGRATRTTHPQVLNGFSKLFTAVFETPFGVENPFIWNTKPEMVKTIIDCGQAALIKNTVSCAHTWEITRLHTHCGHCSQCIDRRFSILSAGAQDHDPAEMYGSDLLAGERKTPTEITMIEEYAKTTMEVAQMTELAFFEKFGEATRVFREFKETSDQVAGKVFDLFQRHSRNVCKVIDDALKEHATDLREGNLPETCLVALAVNKRYKRPVDPKANGRKNDALFKLESWGQLSMKVKDGHLMSVSVDGVTKILSYNDLGLCDRRKNAPDHQWALLNAFAKGHGTLTWESDKADRRNQKKREKLAAVFMVRFGLSVDPIEYVASTKGWKTKFSIEPEET